MCTRYTGTDEAFDFGTVYGTADSGPPPAPPHTTPPSTLLSFYPSLLEPCCCSFSCCCCWWSYCCCWSCCWSCCCCCGCCSCSCGCCCSSCSSCSCSCCSCSCSSCFCSSSVSVSVFHRSPESRLVNRPAAVPGGCARHQRSSALLRDLGKDHKLTKADLMLTLSDHGHGLSAYDPHPSFGGAPELDWHSFGGTISASSMVSDFAVQDPAALICTESTRLHLPRLFSL